MLNYVFKKIFIFHFTRITFSIFLWFYYWHLTVKTQLMTKHNNVLFDICIIISHFRYGSNELKKIKWQKLIVMCEDKKECVDNTTLSIEANVLLIQLHTFFLLFAHMLLSFHWLFFTLFDEKLNIMYMRKMEAWNHFPIIFCVLFSIYGCMNIQIILFSMDNIQII